MLDQIYPKAKKKIDVRVMLAFLKVKKGNDNNKKTKKRQ